MRTFRFLLGFLIAITSCSAFAQPFSFTITGKVDTSLKITNLYFTQGSFYNNNLPKARKIPVQNGQFTIMGEIPEPGPGFLSLAPDLKSKDPANIKQFVLDKGKIIITVKDKLVSASITGSKANDDIVRYTSGQSSYTAKLDALNEAAQQQSQRGVPIDSIIKTYNTPLKEASRELYDYQRQYVAKNPRAFISLMLIPEIGRFTNNYFNADSLLEKLDKSIKLSPSGITIKEYISGEKKTSIGALAPEIVSADTAGKMISLSSLKGKYVLLDFWAAWCGPCRQENPNVVKAYQKYKDKGFTVFGVSVDRERKDWLKGIKDDKLTWQHVSELKYFNSAAAVLYRVTSIPRNFLLDPEGKIIGRDLRGPDLSQKLDEIFKKN